MPQSFDDNFTQYPRLNNLLRALTRCQGFGLYFVRCNTSSLRDTLVDSLKKQYARPIVELPLSIENTAYIDEQIKELMVDKASDAVVFIYDIEKLFYLKERKLLNELNWRRNLYGNIEHPLVFWLPEFVLDRIFKEALDFADWYSGLYEFSLSLPERELLASETWEQVSENFVDALSLKEKQRWIISLKNLLAELDVDSNKTQSQLLNRLGEMYSSIGDMGKALECYQKDLKLSHTLQDKQREGDTLNNISQIYDARGDYDTALKILKQSLAISQDIGNKLGEGVVLNNISLIYRTRGDDGMALKTLEQSLAIRQEIGDKLGEGATLNNISQIYRTRGDDDMALKTLEQSLAIVQEIGDKSGEGTTLNNISQIYRTRGDDDTALKTLKQSLAIMQEIGDIAGLCATLFNIGHIQYQNKANDKAMETWLNVYQLAKPMQLAKALDALSNLAPHLGMPEGLEGWEDLLKQRESE